jgi:hypothetical protein
VVPYILNFAARIAVLDKSIKSISKRPFIARMELAQKSISIDEILKKLSNTAARIHNLDVIYARRNAGFNNTLSNTL